MKIIDFKDLIKEIPFYYQAFDIKRKIWSDIPQQELIEQIFYPKSAEVITINRFDLYSSSNMEEFVLKTLMWGYPTKGRGNNINNLLKPDNFINLIAILKEYQNSEITLEILQKNLNKIKGLGLSTMTKFTHFLNTKINGNRALILDNQIIEAINTKRYEEFRALEGISYDNAVKKYQVYTEIIEKLTREMNVSPDQVEMFLFTFGRILSNNSIIKAEKFLTNTTAGLKIICKK